MMRSALVALLVLLVAAPAWASFYVCGTDADTVEGGFRTYHPTLDPSKAPGDCYEVAPTNIGTQRTLITTTDWRKLRIDTTAKLAVLKSQGVRDAIDAADASAAASAAAIEAELESAGCKSTNLADAEQKVRNQMQVARNAANAMTSLATGQQAILTTIDKTELLFVNVVRCVFALGRLVR